MKPSPLNFARSYEQLRSRLETQPAADLRLLLLAEFWPNLGEFRDDLSYRSYFDEYPSLLVRDIGEKSLVDLLPSELSQILGMALELRSFHKGNEQAGILNNAVELLATEAARKFFYVGAVDEALDCLRRSRGVPISRTAAVTEPCDEFLGDVSELDSLRGVHYALQAANDPLAPLVFRLLHEWELARAALSFDAARCLFVEKSSSGEHTRGRLRSLHGSAEYRRPGASNHELTVDNQIKTPDDPLVGCIHNSLTAAVRLLGVNGNEPAKTRVVRARYRVVDSDHTFTGDSIGLAAGLVAYAQLLRPEVHKHERFVALEVAFTGGLDGTGRLTPVSVEGLKRKVERAFFSSIRYLVLPAENLEAARWCVEEMRRVYPHRQLNLVGATTFREVIDNLNIVRAERVCMGQFVARKAYKYGRATRIQVPLLVALAYLLVCLVYPKAWVGFDDNPVYSRFNVEANILEVFNQDSTVLWTQPLDCDIEYASSECCQVFDLNGDGQSEVLYSVPTRAECANRATLFCYSFDHRLLFKRYCATPNEYPGDTGGVLYSPTRINIMDLAGQSVIITEVVDGRSGLGHIRFWSADGKPMGWYINAGGPHFFVARDMDGDGREEAVFLNYSNCLNASAFLVLKPDSSRGVSPPYECQGTELGGVTRGNQLAYIVFPKTDLGAVDLREPFNTPFSIWSEQKDQLTAHIGESSVVPDAHFIYAIDVRCRVAECWPTNQFRVRRSRLVAEGKLPRIGEEAYLAKVRDAVIYWTDSGWVSEGRLRAAGL